MLRFITRLVLLLVLGVLAPGEAVALTSVRVWPPAASAEKLASWGCDPETAVLRQAATMQAAETQQAASSLGYDFASGRLLAAESVAANVRTPNAAMRANANARGAYVDPLTGNTVPATSNLAADHIVPKNWIKQQPGFSDLTPGQQSWLLNHPLNTQGLPTTFNSSKGAKMPGDWSTYKGQPLDPGYIQNDAQRAQFLQNFMQSQINNMKGGGG